MPILDSPDFVRFFKSSLLADLLLQKPLKKVEPIEIEPFALKTEERGQLHQTNLEMKVSNEIENLKKMQQFKAKPFVEKPFFVPQKSTRPLSEITDIILNSDRRALKRKAFEEEKKQKEQEYMEVQKRLEEEERVRTTSLPMTYCFQIREERELAEYRKTLVHKARPILKAKRFTVQPSAMQLTNPQSPMLLTKRLKLRDL